MRAASASRPDGVPRRAGDPQLLGVRSQFRPPGPHVRAQLGLEPPGAPLARLRLVGEVQRPLRREHVLDQSPGVPTGPSTTLKQYPHGPIYGWTDLTYLLHAHHVSWASYAARGRAPDCFSGPITCYTKLKGPDTPGIWNVLPNFTDVRQDGQTAAAEQPAGAFFAAAARGTLPAVSWVTPNFRDSDHPSASIHTGRAWVTRLVDAVMRGPDWTSTAIFLAW